MKKIIALLGLLASCAQPSFAADVKISQLPLSSAATAGVNDSFPFVQATTNITKRMTLWDLINLPPMVSTFAPKANPIFTGTVTAPSFVGNLTGNASTATQFSSNPTDCGANTFANVIAANGNLTCAGVNTVSLLGNWSAGAFSITANSVELGSAANTISGLSTIVNTGTLTLPTSTDTLVGRNTTDTLTNKSMAASSIASGTLATARGGH